MSEKGSQSHFLQSTAIPRLHYLLVSGRFAVPVNQPDMISSLHHSPPGGWSTNWATSPCETTVYEGVYNSRPRYTQTWDISTVLIYITQLRENKNLSLKHLTLKFAMLMSLTTASRVSEMQALDLRFRQYTQNGVVFRLGSLTKKHQARAPL